MELASFAEKSKKRVRIKGEEEGIAHQRQGSEEDPLVHVA